MRCRSAAQVKNHSAAERQRIRFRPCRNHPQSYYEAFWNLGKPVMGIGINFSSKTRNMEEWKLEEMA